MNEEEIIQAIMELSRSGQLTEDKLNNFIAQLQNYWIIQKLHARYRMRVPVGEDMYDTA
jgi:hypothetical protein